MNEIELKSNTKSNIRMALSFISEAKRCLFDEWNDYADVQIWMGTMEDMRLKTEILLEKYLNGKLK